MRGTRTGRGIGTGIAALALATGGGITTGLLPAAARQAAAPARAAAQRAGGTLIAGRGLPALWLRDGRVVRAANLPATDGHRVSFTLTGHGGSATLRFSRTRPAGRVLVRVGRLPRARLTAAGACGERRSGAAGRACGRGRGS